MKQRIITALILAPLVILAIFELPMAWFSATLAMVTLLGFWEWTQFVDSQSRLLALLPAVLVGALSVALMSLDTAAETLVQPGHWIVLLIGAAWWAISSLLAISYPKSSQYWQHSKLLKQLFGLLTLLPFFWSVLLLRAEGFDSDPYHGAKLVLFVCLIVWAADSGAYFAGKTLGKRKMAPQVSPNKTIEGLIGGVIAAILVALLFADWFNIHFSSSLVMIISTLITVVVSVMGDLVESMFKRESGIKDSSNIIPGHGGVLDRIDSLTAAFPVFTLLYLVF
ncbi:phosphatidate cytidylyltransferase [Vibrio sp.]|uniref:phosphatidate cytidylyltransferase n=1 Tax=Vibrio sp. TaxID=678 RepID=UPI003D14EF7D